MGELYQVTEYRTIAIGHSRWDNCIRTQSLRQLRYDTVAEIARLGHSRQVSYIMTYQWENYIRLQDTEQLQ